MGQVQKTCGGGLDNNPLGFTKSNLVKPISSGPAKSKMPSQTAKYLSQNWPPKQQLHLKTAKNSL